jgi:hypothetical protein
MFRNILGSAPIILILTSVPTAEAQSGRGTGSPAPSELPPGVVVTAPTNDPAKNTQIAVRNFRTQWPDFQAELGVNDADFTVIVGKLLAIGDARNQLIGDPRVQPVTVSIRVIEQGAYNKRLGIIQKPAPWRTRIFWPADIALYELNDALNDPNTPPEVIKEKLENLRAVRAKFEADLRLAMDSLRSIVNQKQEAILESYGYLD